MADETPDRTNQESSGDRHAPSHRPPAPPAVSRHHGLARGQKDAGRARAAPKPPEQHGKRGKGKGPAPHHSAGRHR
jgi:hypothetical protein